MYLHLPRLPPLHSPSKRPPYRPSPKALSDLFNTFDASLLRLLKSLLPVSSEDGARPPVGVSLAYLCRAAAVLSSVHTVAGALISDPSLSGSDEAALASYINSSIRLLDVCNAVSAEIERLHLGRLLLVFIVHLLSTTGTPPLPEKIQKATESIREWEGSSPTPRSVRSSSAPAGGLVGDLKPRGPPPRGKVTALGRAIYAVEAVSALVAGALVIFLGGESDPAFVDEAPREFGWADAFNELRAALSSEICRSPPAEVGSVGASVRKLAEIMEVPADGREKTEERLRSAVKEVERATEKLTEGLDSLRSAVNELFRAGLATRNIALQSFRPGAKTCK